MELGVPPFCSPVGARLLLFKSQTPSHVKSVRSVLQGATQLLRSKSPYLATATYQLTTTPKCPGTGDRGSGHPLHHIRVTQRSPSRAERRKFDTPPHFVAYGWRCSLGSLCSVSYGFVSSVDCRFFSFASSGFFRLLSTAARRGEFFRGFLLFPQ